MPNDIVPTQSPSSIEYSFEVLQRMATTFAKSGACGIKDPDTALTLMLVAHAEGKNPALVARDFDIIQGRPAKKAEAMMRDFQSSGGRIEWIELTDTRAAAKFSHPLAPVPILIDWDMERAQRAGLAGKQGDMYKKFARAMLRSRCISEGVRSTAPGATGQYYTPDEVRAIIQEEEALAPPTVPLEHAATAAAAQVTGALPQEEVDRLVATLDVKTLPELTKAFGAAWIAAKGDDKTRKILKGWYDDMKMAIESGTLEPAAEPDAEPEL